jgi:hypothetical protein
MGVVITVEKDGLTQRRQVFGSAKHALASYLEVKYRS